MAVGAICCRVESMPNGRERVYIMTLGVLEAYRKNKLGTHEIGHAFMSISCKRSIGAALLKSALDYCDEEGMDSIYLHVQTSNADALRFYERFGFEITHTIYNYYKNIVPPDCYILAKSF
jgi:ribosomal protein S18 acetylase RimI-like enzyme